jgi:hypothetical protein
MAVKGKNEGQKLILEIDNGDLTKLEDVIKKWSFKDYQSFFRFAISLLILNEEKSVSIKVDGTQQTFAPASDLLKE